MKSATHKILACSLAAALAAVVLAGGIMLVAYGFSTGFDSSKSAANRDLVDTPTAQSQMPGAVPDARPPAFRVALAVIPGVAKPHPASIDPAAPPDGSPPASAAQMVQLPQATQLAQAASGDSQTHPLHPPRPDIIPAVPVPVDLAALNATLPPPLEEERAHAEHGIPAGSRSGITIETGFECSPKMAIHPISPTHFALQVPSPYWFMFKVHGAAGKTVRFDVVNPGLGLSRWANLNPVYAYTNDIDDPATYITNEKVQAANGNTLERAWNGVELPSTEGQKWHFISNAWEEDEHQFSFTQRFEQDDVTVAMRMPFPPGYAANLARTMHLFSSGRVIEVGQSLSGRPLYVFEFAGTESQRAQKPCFLIYAGEHADEPDAMWAAQGAIDFLASGNPESVRLLSKCTVLVIPMLDPDAAARGQHSGMLLSFHMGARSGESIQYANWFHSWIDASNRLDVVIDLHNIQSGGQVVSAALFEGVGERGALSQSLHDSLMESLQSAGYSVRQGIVDRGWSTARLGGWLSQRYGPLTLAYEVNSQAAYRHLSGAAMKMVGKQFLLATAKFLVSSGGSAICAQVDERRAQRLARLVSYTVSGEGTDTDAIEQESASWEHATADQLKEVRLEKWVP